MTRKDLKQIYLINKEIEMWQTELDRLREQSALRSKPITGMPFANTNTITDSTAELATKILEAECEVIGYKKTLEAKRLSVMREIRKIEDSFLRQLVFYRAVDCRGWEEISDLMGYERTTCSKRYNEYVKTLEE